PPLRISKVFHSMTPPPPLSVVLKSKSALPSAPIRRPQLASPLLIALPSATRRVNRSTFNLHNNLFCAVAGSSGERGIGPEWNSSQGSYFPVAIKNCQVLPIAARVVAE